ncbi:MAG: F0F1 ATP synthase subunit B [Candidatus Alcyoniella australis]|nr:F0F1 ATP synthase subunit B [Candidatus Alcyoniella australis]
MIPHTTKTPALTLLALLIAVVALAAAAVAQDAPDQVADSAVEAALPPQGPQDAQQPAAELESPAALPTDATELTDPTPQLDPPEAEQHDTALTEPHAAQAEHPAQSEGEHAAAAEHGSGHGLARISYIHFATGVLSLAIFLWILIHFARKPLSQYLIDRSEAVVQAIADANRARDEALELQEQWRKRIEGLEAESEQLLAGAQRRAEEDKQRILDEAGRTATKAVDDARAVIEHETAQALERLQGDLAEQALALAVERIKGRLDEQERERFVDGAIAQIESKS